MIAAMEPIGLEELTERAGLLTRVDRKYLVPHEALDHVLDLVPGTTRVLQIGDHRRFGYRSVYFDTPDLLAYRLTALRRRRRFKIRTRSYLDSGLHLLEVKTRGPRGVTLKQRVPYAGDGEQLLQQDTREAPPMTQPVRRHIAGLAALAVFGVGVLAGCSTATSSDTDAGSTSDAVTVSAAQTAEEVLAADQEAHSADDVDTGSATKITLSGDDATTSGDASDSVRIAGSTVTITADGSENTLSDTDAYAEDANVNAALYSSADLTLTGTGSLTVKGNGNDGITSEDGLLITSGTITVTAKDDGIRGKDYVIVDDGAVTVASGGDAIKSDNDTDETAGYVDTAGGTIALTSTAGDGVDAATDLVVTGGTVTATSGDGHSAAKSDEDSTKALKSGVLGVYQGRTITADSSDDALHSNGSIALSGAAVSLATGDDGVHAEDELLISKGTVAVTSSVEGLEAAHITVSGGDTSVTSSDDGVNAAGGTTDSTTDASDQQGDQQQGDQTPGDQGQDGQQQGQPPQDGHGGGWQGGGPGGGELGGGEEVGDDSLTITGGTLVVNAEGDGLDSNGTASMTGGTVVVNGPTNGGNGALDVNGDLTVDGGTLVAAGSAGMVVSPSADSKQGWVSATLDQSVEAGAVIQIVDADKEVIATYTAAKPVQNVVVSSPDVTSGEAYSVYTGGAASGDDTGGLATTGKLGSATQVATVTADEAAARGTRAR